jgi:hypothetical protein
MCCLSCPPRHSMERDDCFTLTLHVGYVYGSAPYVSLTIILTPVRIPMLPHRNREHRRSMKHALAAHPCASQSLNFLDALSDGRGAKLRGGDREAEMARAANQLACPQSRLHCPWASKTSVPNNRLRTWH